MTALGGPPPGAELLDQVCATLAKYVIFPSTEAAWAVTLHVAATHAQPAWQHATRLVVKSAEKRSGKTRLLEVMKELVHNPLPSANISSAALVRSITEDDPPTFIIDEADRIFGGDRPSESIELLTGILNAGFARGWPYVRWDIITRKREECPTFAMAILASKGVDLPDTVEDRAVVVVMRRKSPNETVMPFRARRDIPILHKLRGPLHEWTESCLKALESAEPKMPVEDRAADVWEPLVAVADIAGEEWPSRARQATRLFVKAAEQSDIDASMGTRLLTDIQDIFRKWTTSFIGSRDLVTQMHQLDEAPWRDLELTTRGLSDRLRLYGVKPRPNAAGSARGYRLEDFLDPFARYLVSETVKPSGQDSDQGGLRETPDRSDSPKPSETVSEPSDDREPSGENRRSAGSLTVSDGSRHRDPRSGDNGRGGDPLGGWPPGSIGAEMHAKPTPAARPRRREGTPK